jgi:hypothetical protein
LSETIIAGRLADGTKNQYSGKLKALYQWLQQNYPSSLDALNNQVILSLSDEAITAFFGHVCRKRTPNSRDYLK